MARKLKQNNETYYICEVCGFAYREERWARACQEFCARHHGCSLEITQHAVPLPEGE